MHSNENSDFSSGTLKSFLAVSLLALGLSGCAEIPELAQRPTFRPPASYETQKAFAAAQAAWPNERWWLAYGDPQLDVLIEEAIKGSPDLQMAEARLRRAEALTQVAGAVLGPQVGANATVNSQKLSYNYLTPRSMTPEGWNEYGRATLDLSWELDFWGRNRAGLAAAKSQLAASTAECAEARLNLAAAVAAGYADLARLFAERKTTERSVEIRKKTLALFAERYDNGLETQGSLNNAKAGLASAEGELLLVDEAIAVQRTRLAALLGAGPDRGLAIQAPAVNLGKEFGLPKELALDLLGRRPDIVAARWIAEGQEKRITQKKAEFYPNVNLVAFFGVQALGLDMLTRGGSSVGGFGPTLSLPIFTAGRLQGELLATVASHDEAVANYNRVVTHALQEVASIGLSQQALSGQIRKAEEAEAAAGTAHRVAKNRYEGGLANYIEVLYAEDSLLRARRTRTFLQSRAFALDVAMKRALGGGYDATPTQTQANS